MRQSISTKLVFSLASISVLSVVVGMIGLHSVNRINATLNYISDVAAPTVETSDDIIVRIFKATNVAEEIIADEELDEIVKLKRELKDIDGAFDEKYAELSALIEDDKLMEELKTARIARIRFSNHTNEMIRAHVRELEKKAEGATKLAAFDEAGKRLTIALDEFADENEAKMARAEEEGDKLELVGASAADVNRVLGLLFDQNYPMVEAALKLQRIIIEMQDTAGEYLAEESVLNLDQVNREFNVLYAAAVPHVEVLKKFAITEEEKDDAQNIEIMLEQWRGLAFGENQLFATHREMLEAEQLADDLTELLEQDTDVAAAALDRVAETADAISDGADEAAETAVAAAKAVILGLLIMSIVLSVGMLFFIVKTVVRPIKNLTDTIVALGVRFGLHPDSFSGTGDEVSKLRVAFNQLASQIELRTEQLEMRKRELDFTNKDLELELTRRQELEQQLVQTQKLDGLGTLAGGIAHDFNNMLCVILGGTQLALMDTPENSRLKKTIERIQAAAEHSKTIVNQVLFFSHQDAKPDLRELDIRGAIEESITLLRAGLPTTVHLESEVEDDIPIIYGDKNQIQQIVVNLVTNAFQSSPDRKGKIRIRTSGVTVCKKLSSRHLSLREGRYLRLSVTDNGTGIPSSIQAKIFDPFFTTKPVDEGTGLGLAVVHGIVTAHKGVIALKTKEGWGTKFDIYFPAAKTINSFPELLAS